MQWRGRIRMEFLDLQSSRKETLIVYSESLASSCSRIALTDRGTMPACSSEWILPSMVCVLPVPVDNINGSWRISAWADSNKLFRLSSRHHYNVHGHPSQCTCLTISKYCAVESSKRLIDDWTNNALKYFFLCWIHPKYFVERVSLRNFLPCWTKADFQGLIFWITCYDCGLICLFLFCIRWTTSDSNLNIGSCRICIAETWCFRGNIARS